MDNIKLLFYKPTNLFGKLICWQTRSQYCHVANLINGDTIIEAIEGKGVIKRNAENTDFEIADLYEISPAPSLIQVHSIQNWLNEQIGKKYDWLAVLRFLSRRRFYNNRKFFCSELAFEAFMQAGIYLLCNTEAWEASPGLLSRSCSLIRI